MKDVNSLTMHDHGPESTARILYEFLEARLPLLESRAKMATSMRFMNVHGCRSAIGRSTLCGVGAMLHGVGKQS